MRRSEHHVRTAPALALMFALAAAPACERLTHSSEYEIRVPEVYEGLCNACPDHVGLEHPPCPVASNAPDRDALYVYVWRYYELGFNPDSWTGPNADSFDLGIDLDCSTRMPTGRPAQCRPRLTDGGGEGNAWIPMPRGIDNAMSQRILGPLYEAAKNAEQDGELDKAINEAIAAGGSTVMITVDHWNGTPNDPEVTARIVSVAGISDRNGGPPRWDGNDLWDALSDGADPESKYGAPNTTFKSDAAYVANGTLVLDLAFLGVADLTVVNNGARLDIPVHDFAVIGDITQDELRNISVVGRWALSDSLRSIDDIADFLSGCDSLQRAYLSVMLPDLLATAPDLLLDPASGNRDQPCDAMSIGYGAEAFRAKVGGYRPVSSLPGGCPPPP